MQQKYSKEEKLENNLKNILVQEDLDLHQKLVKDLSSELGVSILDCAAALSFLNQPSLFIKHPGNESQCTNITKTNLTAGKSKSKFIRYRLDIGRKHQVSFDQITNVLIEVSGVDRKGIGKLDIRNYYTLVDLPDGMPVDIFQLLAETEINHQRLNIKRIKYQRRYRRRNNKKSQQSLPS